MIGFAPRSEPHGDPAPKTRKRPKRTPRPSAVCNDCGNKFSIIIESETVSLQAVRLGWCEVSYAACPKCGRVGVVSIVDGEQCWMDKNVSRTREKLRRLKARGASPGQVKAAQEELRRVSDEASAHAKALMDSHENDFRLYKGRYGKKLQFIPASRLDKGDLR